MSTTASYTRPHRSGAGGRKGKGDRVPCTIRFPAEMHERIKTGVDDAGYATVQDFIVDVVEAAWQAGLFPAAVVGRDQLPISA